MIREGEDTKISGHFFMAVVQAVFFFRIEAWVLNPRVDRSLCRFQHRVAQRIVGRQPRRRGRGIWDYPPMSMETTEAEFE